jgi:hypothetical protein
MRRPQQPFAVGLLSFNVKTQEIVVFDLKLARFSQLALFAL